MKLAEILAANVDYLKVNNIEKAMGLTKTALVRIIARKEIPEKHREKIEAWWNNWVASLKCEDKKYGYFIPANQPVLDEYGQEKAILAMPFPPKQKNIRVAGYKFPIVEVKGMKGIALVNPGSIPMPKVDLSDMEKMFQENLQKIKTKK